MATGSPAARPVQELAEQGEDGGRQIDHLEVAVGAAELQAGLLIVRRGQASTGLGGEAAILLGGRYGGRGPRRAAAGHGRPPEVVDGIRVDCRAAAQRTQYSK